MKLADIDAKIEKLDVKPGDILHVAIDRKLSHSELEHIMHDVRGHVPGGVTVMVTTPETEVRLERASATNEPRLGMTCPVCGQAPRTIERTPEGRRVCDNGHVWRMINGSPRIEDGPPPVPPIKPQPHLSNKL